ncbi:MAG: hypothetical protein ACRDPR_00890, partial [Nocardioidaceae bacterium]
DPSGRAGPTRGQARGPGWRQTSYGYYVPTHVSDAVPEQRVLEQSVRLPPGGAVTGWAAARMRGAAFFDGLERDGVTRRPVPLAIGPHASVRADGTVAISRERLDPAEVSSVQGVPCTTVRRALFDEMREARDDRAAVVAMDMMAAAELVSIRQMRTYVAGRGGWRGVPRVRRALGLADENSMSPNETYTRLLWVLDAGLPPPLSNQPVFDGSGSLIGVADLLDPVAGVVGEYDGAAHRGLHRHRRDVIREDRFRRAGLEYFKVVGGDLADPALVVERMRATRERAKFLAPRDRAWTLVPPAGWYDSPLELMTLDERLAYRSALHAS